MGKRRKTGLAIAPACFILTGAFRSRRSVWVLSALFALSVLLLSPWFLSPPQPYSSIFYHTFTRDTRRIHERYTKDNAVFAWRLPGVYLALALLQHDRFLTKSTKIHLYLYIPPKFYTFADGMN